LFFELLLALPLCASFAEESADSLDIVALMDSAAVVMDSAVAVVDSVAQEALSAELERLFQKIEREYKEYTDAFLRKDYTNAICTLLKAGADWGVLTRLNYKGERIFNFSFDFVAHYAPLLMDYGMPVDIRDYNGKTALMSARNSANIEALVRHGADPNITDSSGGTVMHYPMYYQLGARRILVDAGADVNAVDNKGFTPIMREVVNGMSSSMQYQYKEHQHRHELVEELLNLGADPARKTPDGRNLLHLYLYMRPHTHDYSPTVKLLLDAGVNPMETDTAGKRSALYLAFNTYNGGKALEEVREMMLAAAKELDVSAAKKIVRKAKWDKTTDVFVDNAQLIIHGVVSFGYMGYAIADREKIYRDDPQANWVNTVNAGALGFAGGVTSVILLGVILPECLWDKLPDIVSDVRLLVPVIGVTMGVILATTVSRDTYNKNPFVYYGMSALTAALPLGIRIVFHF
jgi:hypothetical protein